MSRILITGGAGFIGTNLCKRLLRDGHEVLVLDDLSSSKQMPENAGCFYTDVRNPPSRWSLKSSKFDRIYHLACPASPPKYQADPIKTMLTSVVGTQKMLKIAKLTGARILFTSTSEIYGEPLEHPQKETYRGNVNSTGIRSCYDEGKRAAESLMYDHQRLYGTDVRVARIFNTFGPHLDLDDGRVVTNFIKQMLADMPITIYGNGQQTRSFCYVDDMVDGLIALMESDYSQPVNLGNPEEVTIMRLCGDLWDIIRDDGLPTLAFVPLPEDDPTQRCPDISLAKRVLGWNPRISRIEGLRRTVEHIKLITGEDNDPQANH